MASEKDKRDMYIGNQLRSSSVPAVAEYGGWYTVDT